MHLEQKTEKEKSLPTKEQINEQLREQLKTARLRAKLQKANAMVAVYRIQEIKANEQFALWAVSQQEKQANQTDNQDTE
jgi:hypothetical protein